MANALLYMHIIRGTDTDHCRGRSTAIDFNFRFDTIRARYALRLSMLCELKPGLAAQPASR